MRKIRPGAAWAAATLVAAVALTGCGSDEREVAQRDGGAVPAQTASGSPSGTPSEPAGSAPAGPSESSGATGQSDPAEPPECTASDVIATYTPGDSAAGTVYGSILVTNTSDGTCTIEGYGGLSYVGDGDGEQIGAAADRDDRIPLSVVELEPGTSAASGVGEATDGNYAADECDPTAVDGFRVYLPDETASLFVEHPGTGCADDAVHLLTHTAFATA